LQQLVEVVGPDRLLGLVALDQDVRGAGVAPVVQQHAEAGAGDLLRERHELVVTAPAARRQRDPRSFLADHPIMDIEASDPGDRHGGSRWKWSARFYPHACKGSSAMSAICSFSSRMRSCQ